MEKDQSVEEEEEEERSGTSTARQEIEEVTEALDQMYEEEIFEEGGEIFGEGAEDNGNENERAGEENLFPEEAFEGGEEVEVTAEVTDKI